MKGACEILGLDPLCLANEGKLIAVAPADAAERVVAAMRAHQAGRQAAMIGEVPDPRLKELVVLLTCFAGKRVVDMPVGEQRPRIW